MRIVRLIHAVFVLGLACVSLAAAPMPSAAPGKLGFDPARLGRMHSMVQSYIDSGRHAGAITMVARDGRIVDFKTYGWQDIAGRVPMRRDTIVRVYSMSKPVTSAAVMQLVEQGRLSLEDPVSRWLPQLKNLKVCTGGTPESPVLADAKRPVTIKQLLTHTAGFAYEFSAPEPVRTLYQRADLLEAGSLEEFVRRLAQLPLARQPGEVFHYGVNTDVLGRVIELVSGQSFESYLEENICKPLGMADTAFDVPPEKMARLAKLYENGPDGALREYTKPPYGTYPEKGRGFASGGGGLFSTADDYMRFAQMLLNGGRLGGRVVLGRKTVELMTANHLAGLEKPFIDGQGAEGFGLGGSVRIALAPGNTLGSVGDFGWSGAATTVFRIDPKEGTVTLLLAQHLPYDQHGIFAKFNTLCRAALVDSLPR